MALIGGVGNNIVLPAVAMMVLSMPINRRHCLGVASAKQGSESFSNESGPRSIYEASYELRTFIVSQRVFSHALTKVFVWVQLLAYGKSSRCGIT
jgi:hypothetical protein